VTDQSSDGSRAFVRGERVWLRAFERDDVDAYWRCVNDREVAYWAGYSAPHSRDNVLDWYENAVRPSHGKSASYFVVSPLGGEEFLGTTWLWNRDARPAGPNSAELSIYIGDPSRWGSGIGTDSVNAALDAAFGFSSLWRVWLSTSATNARSQRSFEKAGFVKEGTLRGAEVRRGAVGDSVLMAILREDWEKLDRPRSWDLA
jgi:RimJ/RimL family protein N-acetyltransferase